MGRHGLSIGSYGGIGPPGTGTVGASGAPGRGPGRHCMLHAACLFLFCLWRLWRSRFALRAAPPAAASPARAAPPLLKSPQRSLLPAAPLAATATAALALLPLPLRHGPRWLVMHSAQTTAAAGVSALLPGVFGSSAPARPSSPGPPALRPPSSESAWPLVCLSRLLCSAPSFKHGARSKGTQRARNEGSDGSQAPPQSAFSQRNSNVSRQSQGQSQSAERPSEQRGHVRCSCSCYASARALG